MLNNAVLVDFVDNGKILALFTELDEYGNKLKCIEVKSCLKSLEIAHVKDVDVKMEQ